jgi:hypothetical protein
MTFLANNYQRDLWKTIVNKVPLTPIQIPSPEPPEKLPKSGSKNPLTFLSHICSGLLPMLYKIDKNPDWKVFLNIVT